MSRVKGMSVLADMDLDTERRLRDVNITSVGLLSVQDPDSLSRLTGIDSGLCRSIIEDAQGLHPELRMRSASEQERLEEKRERLQFGLDGLDKRLLGGILTGSLVEICGNNRGGKSVLCHHLTARTLLPREQGGLDTGVIYLSTQGLPNPCTLKAKLARWDISLEDGWERLLMVTISDDRQLDLMLGEAQQFLATERYGVLILDSLSDLYNRDYTCNEEYQRLDKQLRGCDGEYYNDLGLGDFEDYNDFIRRRSERMTIGLSQVIHLLRRIVIATDCIIIYTNNEWRRLHVTTTWSHEHGRNIRAHGSDYRLYTERGKDGEHTLVLIDNVDTPEFEVSYHIGWGGLYSNALEKAQMEPEPKFGERVTRRRRRRQPTKRKKRPEETSEKERLARLRTTPDGGWLFGDSPRDVALRIIQEEEGKE